MSTAVPPPDRRETDLDPDDYDGVRDRDRRQATTDSGTGAHADPALTAAATSAPADRDATLTRKEVVARQKERFGGMKFGACFFGWLSATGMAVLLSALLAAAGAGVGATTNVDPTNPDPGQAQTAGLIGAIVLLVIILISYFAGGYVAGRMARFNGARQGLGVWLWALIIAVVVAILGAVAGAQFDLLSRVNLSIPISQGDLTTAGVITAVAAAVLALIGAILGGLAGMRYHRRVDKEGLDR